MRPKTTTVTSSNSPVYWPMNWRGGEIGVTATPSGSGNYTVYYTQESIASGASGVTNWTAADGMSAVTTATSKLLGPCTCLKITLHSGTSVAVDVAQRDV